MQQFSPAPTQSSQQDKDAPRDRAALREEMERYLEEVLIQESPMSASLSAYELAGVGTYSS